MTPANTSTHASIEDLHEYVDAFRTSSTRSRYALYVVLIASVLIAIATRNAHPGGWSLLRLKAWYDTPLTEQQFFPDTTQLKVAREEYFRQFIARGVMPSSPIPGVSMDVNDLGLIGGMALALLMLIMLFCLLREHENLQLALYKVRQLCMEDPEGHARGDSKANLLYHALVMGQVLSSPPTLARWRRRGVLRHFGLIFYIPVMVQTWVLWNNWATRQRGAQYGVDVVRSLVYQSIIALAIFTLSSSALIASRAMAKRWTRAFYRVNPARRYAPQPTLLSWMKLKRAPKAKTRLDKIRPQLVNALVDTLSVADVRKKARVPARASVEVKKPEWPFIHQRIRTQQVRSMEAELYTQGEAEAKEWCAHNGRGANPSLVAFHPERNEYRPRQGGDTSADWVVSGTWTFYYLPNSAGTSALSQGQAPAGSDGKPVEAGQPEPLPREAAALAASKG